MMLNSTVIGKCDVPCNHELIARSRLCCLPFACLVACLSYENVKMYH